MNPIWKAGAPFATVTAEDGRRSVLFTRLLALSDGVFAISLTLLVLNIEVPADAEVDGLGPVLAALQPDLIAFVVTVFVVGIYWRNHHQLFETFRGLDGTLVGLSIGYLALIALVPLPNDLISSYQFDPWAYVAFATLLTLLSALDTGMFVYAWRAGLVRRSISTAAAGVEVTRGLVSTLVFAASVPLAFVLVSATPLLWIALLVLDRLVVSAGERTDRG
ncbi:TMEM175 family protein [Natronorarus salvus]|uniref:TMEM175 family protein n=1 Tax=Natronorarus salvus TaxID=3117733 RepID=UPI002F26BC97